ncbi:hypothetical protein [Actinophytocola sp.]|uniref:hypothetical protein n=1 Tax=Actinophytocola sp. TaxID=1872138 RepID=UPI002ED4B296
MRYVILTHPGDDLAMARYHDELVQAGVLLAGDQAAGFWLLEVDTRAEADEWARRVPHDDVEVRELAGR